MPTGHTIKSIPQPNIYEIDAPDPSKFFKQDVAPVPNPAQVFGRCSGFSNKDGKALVTIAWKTEGKAAPSLKIGEVLVFFEKPINAHGK